MKLMKSISHFGDIIAIPGFALLIFYFYNISEKTPLEWLLFVFVIGGFLADLLFTYIFLSNKKSMVVYF